MQNFVGFVLQDRLTIRQRLLRQLFLQYLQSHPYIPRITSYSVGVFIRLSLLANLNLQSNKTHQLNCIAFFNRSPAQLVVERHHAIIDLVSEMNVPHVRQ